MTATVLIIVPVRMIAPMVIILEGMAAATAAMPNTTAADRGVKAEAGGVAGAARREVGATTITATMAVGLREEDIDRLIIMIVTVAGLAQNRRFKGGGDMAEVEVEVEVEAEAEAEAGTAETEKITSMPAANETATTMDISIISSPPSMRWSATTRREANMRRKYEGLRCSQQLQRQRRRRQQLLPKKPRETNIKTQR